MTVSSVGCNSMWSYFKRAAKIYPDFVLGTGNEVFTDTLRKSFYGSKNAAGKRAGGSKFSGFGNQLKSAIKEVEKHNDTLVKKEGGFWKSNWKALKTTPDVVKAGWRDAGTIASKAGKTGVSKFGKQLLGGLKGLGKRMPLIGSMLIVACEIPNICTAIKEKGLIQGLKETGKAGARVGAGMAGMAIGQALIPIPFVGGLIGYIAGDWLASKVVGKSYSEKKMEAEQQAQEQQAMQQQQYTADPNMFTAQNQYQQQNTQQASAVPYKPQIMPTMNQNDLLKLQQALYGPGAMGNNFMDNDFMAMATGLNRLA